jgi:hypothetical protein
MIKNKNVNSKQKEEIKVKSNNLKDVYVLSIKKFFA